MALVVLGLFPGRIAAAEIEGKVNLPPAPASANPVIAQRYNLAGPAIPVPKPGVVYAPDGTVMPTPRVGVVYLEGEVPAPAAPPPSKRIEQKDLAFSPSFLVIQVGTTVEFPNLDDFNHSVFSHGPAKRFDLGIYSSKEAPPPQLFDKPGLEILRCDIHANMRALILIVPTRYFVMTDKEGRYRLPDVPPGKYKLKVWKDSSQTLEREVLVPAEGTLHIDFP